MKDIMQIVNVMVEGSIWLFLYYIIKIKYVNKLKGLMIFSHIFFLFFSIYPILSSKEWNEYVWTRCVVDELALIVFSFTIYRLDNRMMKIYEILSKSQFVIIMAKTCFNIKQIEIEDMEKKIESLFIWKEKYKSPYNIVIIGLSGKRKKIIECNFVFWNLADANKFVQSNSDFLIKETSKKNNGICLQTIVYLNN